MPLPAIPVILGPATAAAAKAAAIEYLPAASSVTLAAVLARMALNRIPAWIKEDLVFQSPQADRREMEHLSSVLEKLQALADSASERLQSPVPYLYASLLAYIQLSAQIKRLHPDHRDERYHRAGVPIESVMDARSMDEEFGKLKEALDFAVAAYYVEDENFLTSLLTPLGFELIHRSVATRPGSVGHFMAVSAERKILLVGVKGTSSLEDLFTDSCGRSISYEDGANKTNIEVRGEIEDEVISDEVITQEVEVVSGHERISVHDGEEDDYLRCHEGIFIAAQRLEQEVRPTVEELVVQGDYSLMLVGHSLGGSAACLLSVVLRKKFPKALDDDRIHVYAFAPPPVLNHDSAIATTPFITSVVNNSDIVARSNLGNLHVFLEFLRAVSEKLETAGLAPTSPRTTTAFLRKLSEGDTGDPLMSLEEVILALDAAHDKVELRHPLHLFVPGRVLLLHQDWGNSNSVTDTDKSEEERPYFCTVTDGTASILRFFEVDGFSFLGDHTTAAYANRIGTLRQKAKTSTPSSS